MGRARGQQNAVVGNDQFADVMGTRRGRGAHSKQSFVSTQPLTAQAGAGLRGGRSGLMLTKMQTAVLNHPAWAEKQFVTAHDLTTQAHGDGLPASKNSAQRILCVLNGGPSGTGTQYIAWCPDKKSITGTRFTYELLMLGAKARAQL